MHDPASSSSSKQPNICRSRCRQRTSRSPCAARRALFLRARCTGITASLAASAEPLTEAPWSLEPGAAIAPYEVPSRFEKSVTRTLSNPNFQPGAQGARTPHHLLNGTITPNGLHYVVSYGGAPDIDPDKHRLVIHGLVKRPLVFTLEALSTISHGVAHNLSRMRRKQRAAVFP